MVADLALALASFAVLVLLAAGVGLGVTLRRLGAMRRGFQMAAKPPPPE